MANVQRLRLRIQGMTCPACEQHVVRALEGIGATEVSARYRLAEASCSLSTDIPESTIADAIGRAGYCVLRVGGADRASEDGSRFSWLAILIAIPAMALCCGGPVLLAAAGAALTAAAAWVWGYGGLALLAVAGAVMALFWARRRGGVQRRRSDITLQRGNPQ